MGVEFASVEAAVKTLARMKPTHPFHIDDFSDEWVDDVAQAIPVVLNAASDLLAELAALRQANAELRAMRDQQFSMLQQVRAELKTSQQRVSELEADDRRIIAELKAVLDAATGTDDVTISVPMVAGSVARFVKQQRDTLASREAALRDVAHLLGPWTQPAEGRPRGLTAAVKLAYDRAAQEVGR